MLISEGYPLWNKRTDFYDKMIEKIFDGFKIETWVSRREDFIYVGLDCHIRYDDEVKKLLKLTNNFEEYVKRSQVFDFYTQNQGYLSKRNLLTICEDYEYEIKDDEEKSLLVALIEKYKKEFEKYNFIVFESEIIKEGYCKREYFKGSVFFINENNLNDLDKIKKEFKIFNECVKDIKNIWKYNMKKNL